MHLVVSAAVPAAVWLSTSAAWRAWEQRALILEPESLLPFVEVLLSFEVENWEQRHCCGAGTPPAFC